MTYRWIIACGNWTYCPLSTEIQPSERELPEEWPPGGGPHQTSTLLSISSRQPGVWLLVSRRPSLPPGALHTELEPQTAQTRRRRAGSHKFIQRLHHPDPGPQTWGCFHWHAVWEPCKVRNPRARTCVYVLQMRKTQQNEATSADISSGV